MGSGSVDYVQALCERIAAADDRLARAESRQDEPAVRSCREDLRGLCALARRCSVYAVVGRAGRSVAMSA